MIAALDGLHRATRRSRAELRRTTVALPDLVSLARRFDPSLVHISTLNGAYAARSAGLGSGVVLRSDGYIVTNEHVIRDAEKIFIRLADRRELAARVVGRDERSDLALLQVAARAGLAAAPLGDSSRVQTGEWVVALGSPFGLDRTMTVGIVSARARRLPASPYSDYIQTDVTINPGNSGGPLLDLQGRVVGINTAILSRDGTNTGINFAIPVNFVKELLPALYARGRVIRGWVGLAVQTLTPAAARHMQIEASGALVVGVTADGPAAQAGIRPGDVVVAYDGREVARAGELPRLVARTTVGRRVALDVSRNRLLYRPMVAVREFPEGAAEPRPHTAVLQNRAAEFHS